MEVLAVGVRYILPIIESQTKTEKYSATVITLRDRTDARRALPSDLIREGNLQQLITTLKLRRGCLPRLST